MEGWRNNASGAGEKPFAGDMAGTAYSADGIPTGEPELEWVAGGRAVIYTARQPQAAAGAFRLWTSLENHLRSTADRTLRLRLPPKLARTARSRQWSRLGKGKKSSATNMGGYG